MKKVGDLKAFGGSWSSKPTSTESTITQSEQCRPTTSTISSSNSSPIITGVTTCTSSSDSSSVPSNSQQSSSCTPTGQSVERSHLTPAQSKIREKMNDVNEKIAMLTSAPLHELTKGCLTQLKKRREELSKRLKILSTNQKANQRYRQKRKSEWNDLVETDSSNSAIKKI